LDLRDGTILKLTFLKVIFIPPTSEI